MLDDDAFRHQNECIEHFAQNTMQFTKQPKVKNTVESISRNSTKMITEEACIAKTGNQTID